MPASASESESEGSAADDSVLSLLSRKPLGSLKWVVVESEADPDPPQPPDNVSTPRGQPRRSTTPRGPEGFWSGPGGFAAASATPPRPLSPATPPTAGAGAGASNGGGNSHSRRVYRLDVDKPMRLVADASHTTSLGASPPLPMRVLSVGRGASSSSPSVGDGGLGAGGSQGSQNGDGGGCWRRWPSVLVLVLVVVGAALGVLFGLGSAVGLRMGLLVVVAALAVIAGLVVVWACCRQAEAAEAAGAAAEEDGERQGFLEGGAAQRDGRPHYGSTFVGS